jgi:hypothetical protein
MYNSQNVWDPTKIKHWIGINFNVKYLSSKYELLFNLPKL